MDKLNWAFGVLKTFYGSHYNAAKNLGLTPEHYRKLRNGRARMTKRTADHIMLKAFEHEGSAVSTRSKK